MRAALFWALLLFGMQAQAEWYTPVIFGTHVASAHKGGGFQAANPGFYLRTEGNFQAGAFANSVGRTSAYAGYFVGAHDAPLNLMLGMATGYKKRYTVAIVPTASLDLTERARLRFWLIVNPANPKGSAAHVSLEWVL
jgi:hypothetical protein